jgi:hypothetical protein
MKYYLLAGLLMAAVPALAQKAPPAGQEAPQPFKKANTIIIHTTDSTTVAYKKIAGVLLGAGYTLDRADKELGFMNTKPRPTSTKNAVHTIRVAILPAQSGVDIQLKSSFATPTLAAISPIMAGDMETDFRGMKGSPIMASWDEMQKVAVLYSGGQLAYKAQP